MYEGLKVEYDVGRDASHRGEKKMIKNYLPRELQLSLLSFFF